MKTSDILEKIVEATIYVSATSYLFIKTDILSHDPNSLLIGIYALAGLGGIGAFSLAIHSALKKRKQQT